LKRKFATKSATFAEQCSIKEYLGEWSTSETLARARGKLFINGRRERVGVR